MSSKLNEQDQKQITYFAKVGEQETEISKLTKSDTDMLTSISDLTKKVSMTVTIPQMDALEKKIKELPTYDKEIAQMTKNLKELPNYGT